MHLKYIVLTIFETNKINFQMKKLLIPLLIIAGFFAIYEQTKEKPNLYISCVAFVVLMFSIMQLSTKVKSKNDQNDNENVE